MKLIIMSGQEKTPYLFIYTYMYRYLCEYSNKINFTDLFNVDYLVNTEPMQTEVTRTFYESLHSRKQKNSNYYKGSL